MAYKDCPCLTCKDRAHGEKRVAGQKSVSNVSFVGYFLSSDKCQATSLRTYFQELRRKEKESHPYYSETRQKIIRKHQLKRKGGRRI